MRYFIRHKEMVDAIRTNYPGDVAGKSFSSGDYLVECENGYVQSVPGPLFEQVYALGLDGRILQTSGLIDMTKYNQAFCGIGKIPHDDYGYWNGLSKPIVGSC